MNEICKSSLQNSSSEVLTLGKTPKPPSIPWPSKIFFYLKKTLFWRNGIKQNTLSAMDRTGLSTEWSTAEFSWPILAGKSNDLFDKMKKYKIVIIVFKLGGGKEWKSSEKIIHSKSEKSSEFWFF